MRVKVTTRSRLALLGALAVGCALAAFHLRTVLAPFFLAGVLAYLLHPAVTSLETRSVPRGVGILILYLAVGVVLWGVGKLVLPDLTREIHELAQSLPQQTERFQGLTRRTVEDVRNIQLPATLEDVLSTLLRRAEELLEAFAVRVGELLFGFMSGVLSLVLSPILAFYLLRDWSLIRDGFLDALPAPWRVHALRLGERINHLLHGYIRGQLLVSALVGAMAAIALIVLDIPYALMIGLLAGLLDIIPYFGPVLGTLPAAALGLMESPQRALYVVLAFAAIQQLESGVLSPKIVGGSVGLHPLTVIAVVLVGAEVFGILGMLVSVPLTATLKVLWCYWQEQEERQAGGGQTAAEQAGEHAPADPAGEEPAPGT